MSHIPRTQSRLIAALRGAGGPVDTATLAEALGLHPNGVRENLRRLAELDLVERERERRDVGRPRDLWRLTPRAIAREDREDTGWAMARALARAIPATPERLREVLATGRAMGAELAEQVRPLRSEDPAETIDDALAALGFEPRRETAGDDIRYRLMTCPYADAVRENQAVVCTLHRGVVDGVLEGLGLPAELTEFSPRDPDVAGCVVAVRLTGRESSGD